MSRQIGEKIIRLQEIDSTNTYVKNNVDLIKQHGLVILTKMQTSGRGRLGRKFISIPDKNVTFSVILHPHLPFEKIHLYSLLAGVVVSRVLENYVDDVKLKWPNDVLVRGKKICGILIESIQSIECNHPCLILGIGLNTKGNIKDYPIELQRIVTTLEEEMFKNSNKFEHYNSDSHIENEKIFQDLLTELDICIKFFTENDIDKKNILTNNFNQKTLLQEWLERSKSVGVKVRFYNNGKDKSPSSENIGIIEGLTNEGYLLIKTKSGQLITHMSGDIVEI